MFASKFMDVVIGVDLHLQEVPTPAGVLVPVPLPTPFMGMLFDPMQMAMTLLHGCPGLGLVSIALDPIGSLVNMAADKIEGVGGGPVLINGVPATNTQSQVTTTYGIPHIVCPPAVMFLDSGTPEMEGQGTFPFGSSSVWINGRRAVRALLDPVSTCSDPVSLPTSITMPVPLGSPVVVGGASTPDLQAIISGAIRHAVTNAIKEFVGTRIQAFLSDLPESRLRNFISAYVCFATGHPVDVATGRMFTTATDWKLPGPLPLKFERQYCSVVSDRDGALGFGWSHPLDQSVWLERGRVVYRAGDGREIQADTFDFPGRVMRPGDETFEPCNRLTFRRRQGGWEIENAEGVAHEFGRVKGDRIPGRWRLTKIRARDGHAIVLEYDEQGTLAWVHDSAGRVVRFTHDRDGRLTQVELPHPTQDGWLPYVKYSYSKDGNLVAVEDALGHTTRYEYSGHLMVRETDRTGLSFYFGYDGADSSAWCVRTWGDGGIYDHTIDYDKAGLKTYVTNSLGHTTAYRMNEALAVVEVTDPHGGKTRYEYDNALRKTAEIDPLGNVARWEYDARGNRAKRVGPDGGVVRVEYDAADLPVRAVDAVGGEWRWSYDAGGHLVEEINPLAERWRYEYSAGLLAAQVSPFGQRTGFTYDSHKNLTWVERPNGAKVRYDYDRKGHRVYVRDERGGEWRTTYDANGRAVRREGPTGEVEQRRYDGEGHLLEARSPLRHVRFGYIGLHKPAWREEAGTRVAARHDTEGRLTEIANQVGETHAFTRDALGRAVREVTFDGIARDFRYDHAGRLSEVRHPDGTQDAFTYDAAGRLTERRHGDGTFCRFRYRPDGALLEAENETGVIAFDRDGLGRITRERQGEHVVASQYGADGLRWLMETSLGGRQEIRRDVLGHAQVLHLGPGGAGQRAIRFEHDEAGFETERALPGNVRVQWRRDLAGRPTSRRTLTGTRDGLQQSHGLAYEWAGEDQLGRLVDSRTGPARYAYDERGRLVREERPGAVMHRAMDATGNVFRAPDGHDRRFGRGGRLETADGSTYGYDANGNLSQKRALDGSTWRYQWNGVGLLREVERPDGLRVRFEYDPLARRTRKALVRTASDGRETLESETRFVWDRQHVVHEIANEKASTTWYWAPGSFAPVAREEQGRYGFIASDHLGTPTEMYDEAGRLAWRMQLDAFGAGRQDVATERCPWRWPGQYADDETGLHYNRFRYYDPESGGYISPDRLGLAGGLRLRGYPVNPLTWVDPLGLTDCGLTQPAEGGEETFYRTISEEHYQQLLDTGRVQATGETFVSPTQGYSEGFTGVTVEFTVKAGTTEQLAEVGVKDSSNLVADKYPEMPDVSKGWGTEHAYFKAEPSPSGVGQQINIGLGKGTALDIFNNNIVGFHVVR